MLDTNHRNTPYGQFQNVKNAISVLIQRDLLQADNRLPENLRTDTNTEKYAKIIHYFLI
jgi:hypothetical protein